MALLDAGEQDIVEDGFQVFLSAASGDDALEFGGVGGQGFQGHVALADVLTDALVVGCVTLGHELVNATVLDDLISLNQAESEGVHARDVGQQHVLKGVGLTACLGVEVQTAVHKAACLDDLVHTEGGIVDIGGELVGIPAQQHIALVGVDGAEDAVDGGHAKLVLEGVACQGGVVGLDVHAEVVHEAVGTQEVSAGGHVEIVLVLGGLLGLGLDVEVTRKSLGAAVVAGQGQELAEIVQLQSHIGIDEGVVALAAAPEDVAGGTQLDGGVDACLDLTRGDGVDVSGGGGGGACHEHLVAEHIGGHPQGLDAGGVLLFQQVVGHDLQILDGLSQGLALGSHVHVVEAIELNAQLLHEVEGEVHLGLVHGYAIQTEGLVHGVAAEHIGARGVAGVPPAQSEAQMLGHGLAVDDAVLVVVTERKGILGSCTLVRDGVDVVVHSYISFQ